ncbi:MAG: sugar phosphate isomerase/epimerase family protein, partial [Gemmatimonadota bacterium]|nr:sugar phosphate isomerase/epimerase family protein [Gemmatimonadota bacterium]
ARRVYDIDAVEYVNTFFFGATNDRKLLREMKNRADGEGVESLLIMCDFSGNLGDQDDAARTESVEAHRKWVEVAQFLGCHSIRVNARSAGAYEEQQQLAADGLRRLCEFSDDYDINILVENHGGFSSNGVWLSGVMDLVDHPRVGTLPDFGNFNISQTEKYDNYQGLKELMPYAKGVSAKTYDFDRNGDETTLDYSRLLKIVLDAGYSGHIGIEYEGAEMNESDGIRATKALLVSLREEMGG